MTSPLLGWTTLDTSTDTLQLRQQDLTDLLNTSPLLAGWTLVSGVARVTASSARIDAVFVRQGQYARFRYRLHPAGSTASLELTEVGRSPDQSARVFRICLA